MRALLWLPFWAVRAAWQLATTCVAELAVCRSFCLYSVTQNYRLRDLREARTVELGKVRFISIIPDYFLRILFRFQYTGALKMFHLSQ